MHLMSPLEASMKCKDARVAVALAQMLEFGLGGTKNLAEAKKWYMVAAAGNYKNALQKVKELQLTDLEKKKVVQLESDAGKKDVEKGPVFTTYAINMNQHSNDGCCAWEVERIPVI